MSIKNGDFSELIWLSVRTGTTGAFIMLVLLLPVSFLIWKGTQGEGSIRMVLYACALMSGIAASIIQKRGKNFGMQPVLLVFPVTCFIFLLMAAGIPGNKINFIGIATIAAVMSLGTGIVHLMQNNKTDIKRRKRR